MVVALSLRDRKRERTSGVFRSFEVTRQIDVPCRSRLLSRSDRATLSEQGVNVLFVAFGFLKWFEAEHSDEPRLSPLLLVPVCLERIGATAPWKLSLYEDEPFLSPRPGFAGRGLG